MGKYTKKQFICLSGLSLKCFGTAPSVCALVYKFCVRG